MASLIYIMGIIIKLTGNKSIQPLSNNLVAYIAQSKGTRSAAAAMSAELELMAFKWTECGDKLTAAKEQAEQLQSTAPQSKQATSDALKSLKELQAHAAKETAVGGSASPEL